MGYGGEEDELEEEAVVKVEEGLLTDEIIPEFEECVLEKKHFFEIC